MVYSADADPHIFRPKTNKTWHVTRPNGAIGRNIPPMVRHDGAPVAQWWMGWENMVALPDVDNEPLSTHSAVAPWWRHNHGPTAAGLAPGVVVHDRQGTAGPSTRPCLWRVGWANMVALPDVDNHLAVAPWRRRHHVPLAAGLAPGVIV